MSKQEKFPPRRFIDQEDVSNTQAMAWLNNINPTEYIMPSIFYEYLSLAECDALIAEARAEAFDEASKKVGGVPSGLLALEFKNMARDAREYKAKPSGEGK
jgi:hypothetical protein